MTTSEAGPTESARPRGRRPSGGDTRGTILAAARAEFAERGYDGASIRSVARRADVDPALVRHYFSHKSELFAAGMVPARADPADLVVGVTAGGLEGLGARLLTTILELWEADGGAAFRVAFAGLGSSEVHAEALLGYAGREVYAAVAQLLPAPDRQLRISLVVSHVAGVLLARNIAYIEPIASLPVPRVVELVAPTLQRYLTGPV
ncbi:TetR/AcrR family transcriptional regulator [Cellulomonas sp. URHD0024]|uniref:TetR/AcrR family transcriptional regulator n=1 Tax=Cellulomonas sp. URHD0024 TaxID=1302620 RepID=UPI000421818F|nr:TetR family transcriptional regulator [Cellulomonas sp. URHD0024]